MNPVSTPVTPSIPAETLYPASRLNLFTEYDRASFKAAFGIDPPTFDDRKPQKNWFDTDNASGDTIHFGYYELVDGQVVRQTLTLSAADAATVNIWGIHSYPAWNPPPSNVTHFGGPVAPAELCTPKEANELAWELDPQGTLGIKDHVTVIELQFDDGSNTGYMYPPDEERRVCMFQYRGNWLSCGKMIKNKYAAGVGAPGRWDMTSAAEPLWVSTQPISIAPPTLKPVPVPQRELDASQEKPLVTSAGMGFVVVREGDPNFNPQATGGGLNNEQDRKLSAIYSAVVKAA